jgi:hypothetical protein
MAWDNPATWQVWKFPIDYTRDEQVVMMPVTARPLTVDLQHGIDPCLWALCDPDKELVERKVYIRGTGHPMGDASRGTYVGTYFLADGALVFHVFIA